MNVARTLSGHAKTGSRGPPACHLRIRLRNLPRPPAVSIRRLWERLPTLASAMTSRAHLCAGLWMAI